MFDLTTIQRMNQEAMQTPKMTAYQLAWKTLADHAIQPGFRRSGDQIAKLIEEAIEADRKQR